jgi:hypothetical protein
MAVTLSRTYAGYPSGQVVELGAATEAALIAQNLAVSAAVTAITTGAVTANVSQGTVAVAAAASSVVVTNALVDAGTKIWACVSQATADTTFTAVLRIVPAAGSFTIYGAAATATTLVDWAIIPQAPVVVGT